MPDPFFASPQSSRRRPTRRLGWVRGPKRNDSVRIGIAGTIVAHILLVWLGPKFEEHFMHGGDVQVAMLQEPETVFDIEIMPDLIPPDQFVETNPDAPDNPPDETDQFGARNQQLAQEVAAEEEGDMPSTEGEDDVDSTAIVSGEGVPPQPPTFVPPPEPEVTEETTEEAEEEQIPALAQDPLGGTEEIQGDSEDGIGTNVVELPENPTDVDERIEGITDPTQTSATGVGIYYRPNPTKPAPRPVLASSQNRPTIFTNRVNGTKNLGVIAHAALKTTYGEYLERLIGVVDRQWNLDIRGRIEGGHSYPYEGTKTNVTFTLDKSGKITIDKVDGTAGQLWNGVAVEAVAAPSRYSEGYGEWPDDMIAIIGDSTELKFTFRY